MLMFPDFFDGTLVERERGFFLKEPAPAGLLDRACLSDSNYWLVLACALERCKMGDFDVFEPLARAMAATDDGLFYSNCAALFAFGAPHSELGRFRSALERVARPLPPPLIRLLCGTLARSQGTFHVEEILLRHASTEDEDVRVLVPMYLSHLLEDEPGIVESGPALEVRPDPPPPFEEYFRDYESYGRAVIAVRDRVALAAGNERTPVVAGRPSHVIELARRIARHAARGEDSPRTNFERLAFEAATGISCLEFFEDSREAPFRPLAATAIVEDFLASESARLFAPGARYFFGRPIPP